MCRCPRAEQSDRHAEEKLIDGRTCAVHGKINRRPYTCYDVVSVRVVVGARKSNDREPVGSTKYRDCAIARTHRGRPSPPTVRPSDSRHSVPVSLFHPLTVDFSRDFTLVAALEKTKFPRNRNNCIDRCRHRYVYTLNRKIKI